MQVKLWQVIWLLLKQWRNWNNPVDFVGLVVGLRKAGVNTANSDEWEKIRLQEFLDSIENPSTEQIERNKKMVSSRVSLRVIDEETRKKNLEIAFEVIRRQIETRDPEVTDKNFWNAVYALSINNPKNAHIVDNQFLRAAIKNKRKLAEQFGHKEFLEYPEDIVPGEEPIAINLAQAQLQEKHVLDND